MKRIYLLVIALLTLSNYGRCELGAGSGSAYPTTLDIDFDIETSTTRAKAASMNDVNNAVIKIETELGTLPKGSFGTVKARLTQVDYSTKTINELLNTHIGSYTAITILIAGSTSSIQLLANAINNRTTDFLRVDGTNNMKGQFTSISSGTFKDILGVIDLIVGDGVGEQTITLNTGAGVTTIMGRSSTSKPFEIYVDPEGAPANRAILQLGELQQLLLQQGYVVIENNGNLIILSTVTIQGNAFSVGGSTFVIYEGMVGIGKNPSYSFDMLQLVDGRGFQITSPGGSIIGNYQDSGQAIFGTVSNHPFGLQSVGGTRLWCNTDGSVSIPGNFYVLGNFINPVTFTSTVTLLNNLGVKGNFTEPATFVGSGTFLGDLESVNSRQSTAYTNNLDDNGSGWIAAQADIKAASNLVQNIGGPVNRFGGGYFGMVHSTASITTGELTLPNYTTAELQALAPERIGSTVFCSTDSDLYVSTGPAVAAWRNTRTTTGP